jgi:IAA-amino acid hydrolase
MPGSHSALLLAVVLCFACLEPATSSSSDAVAFASIVPRSILSQIDSFQNWTVGHRRALHQIPELMFALHDTSAYVQSVLNSLHIPFTLCARGVGIVADIGSGRAPCVALRADMDALPITEAADVDFKSQRPGAMHACGHDSHTAMLLAAARVLKAHEASLQGVYARAFLQPNVLIALTQEPCACCFSPLKRAAPVAWLC